MSARRAKHRGITIVEVVAIIVVLAILLALFVPALNRQHAPSRRDHCQHRMTELGRAMAMFDEAHGFIPGIANPPQPLVYAFPAADGQPPAAGAGRTISTTAGYVPLVLPYLKQRQIWEQWTSGQRVTPFVPELLCPAIDEVDPNGNGQLSYIVNDGMAVTDGVDKAMIQASGVCFDRTGTLYPPIEVTMKYVEDHDGAAHTFLLSENLLANHWNTDNPADAKRWNSFVWHADPVPAGAKINGPAPASAMTDKSLNYSRPSSNHPGGVNAGFCDGRVEFIDQSIDYQVFRQLMTSDRVMCP
jgi:prepilin-type processing-associated H-X9-DG protein